MTFSETVNSWPDTGRFLKHGLNLTYERELNMTFDDPQENEQDETTAFLPRFGGLNYIGDDEVDQPSGSSTGQQPSIGQRIMQISRQQLPVASQVMPDAGSPDGEVRRIFPAGSNQTRTNSRGLSIGQRILGLSPETVTSAQQSGLAQMQQTESKPGLEGPQGHNIFAGFVPGGAGTFLNSSSSGFQPSSFPGMGDGSTPDQTEKPDSAPVVQIPDQRGARSMIPKQSSSPQPKPPKLRPDGAQLQQKLGQLMTDLRGPTMTPMGVAPDGAPMLDMTSQVRAPSKIFSRFVYGDKVEPEFFQTQGHQ